MAECRLDAQPYGANVKSLHEVWRRSRSRLFGISARDMPQETVRSREELTCTQHELGKLRGQGEELSKNVAELRGALAQQRADLAARIERPAIVATEHPEIAAATAHCLAVASPAVSIIMSTWNRGHVVGTAIRSVQAQQFADWELIVVDDGSTDTSYACWGCCQLL
jgi:hypothetical protein